MSTGLPVVVRGGHETHSHAHHSAALCRHGDDGARSGARGAQRRHRRTGRQGGRGGHGRLCVAAAYVDKFGGDSLATCWIRWPPTSGGWRRGGYGALVALAGFMGSGKSAVGALVAELLGWRFVDLDDEIVSKRRNDGCRLLRASRRDRLPPRARSDVARGPLGS